MHYPGYVIQTNILYCTDSANVQFSIHSPTVLPHHCIINNVNKYKNITITKSHTTNVNFLKLLIDSSKLKSRGSQT
jgi:hypothetical protein